MSGDETFEAVNRLLAEYLARSAAGESASALAKRLLEVERGRIEACSDDPGKGTELILQLPVG